MPEGSDARVEPMARPSPSLQRSHIIERVFTRTEPWDFVVVGGGATGVGIAVDAASRGFSVCLVEQCDFGKGTSSRSTKLVHGGVRYLQQGNISLVMEALEERGILRQNAPHLVHDLAFVVPNYTWWEAPFYGIGMKVYDLLAGKWGFGKSRTLSSAETLERIPTLETDGLRGGVMYFDGQFDDARLLISLVRTAHDHGAAMLNYVRCVGLHKDADGYIAGVDVRDEESGRTATLPARCVINATGCFSDAVRQMDDPRAAPLIAPSQGVHVVLPGAFLSGNTAIMVPRTSDGRVMFAIPWHGLAVLGTTDTPIDEVSLEPRALDEEIDFLLEAAATYMTKNPARADVLSVFVGIRPLVKTSEGPTASLSRDHAIHIAPSGLLTIAGGKWTTYRHMAEDCVDQATNLARLEQRPCVTKELRIHGAIDDGDAPLHLFVYGTDADSIMALADDEPELATPIHARLPIIGAQIAWGARNEMARTVDDVLSRRTRALLFDARAAIEAAPAVARRLASELGRDEDWVAEQVSSFQHMAERYVITR